MSSYSDTWACPVSKINFKFGLSTILNIVSSSRVGSGTYDFKKHFEVLNEIGYQELHCMEIIHQNADDLRLIAQDIKGYEK